MKNLPQVSACIDIGHLGIYFVRQIYRQIEPSLDVCTLHPSDQRLPGLIEGVQGAVESALPEVLFVVRQLAALGKPLHFHLHDGHPLSILSHFGVSDHLSFLEKVPVPFLFKGRRQLDTMFGPQGLADIIAAAGASLDPELLTFTLEIHPGGGRLPLGDASYLFSHWQDKGNAEKMNFWLDVLVKNADLLVRH